MQTKTIKFTSYVYLLLVPIFTAGLGFGVGHVSYKIYLPLWLINVLLMIIASWSLGLKVTRQKDKVRSSLAKTAFLLIVPTILISMFAGLGPPPDTATEWVDSLKEQQIRYFMLVICGVFIAFGFVSLRDWLKSEGETFYSSIALTSVLIAIPLFIINMLYWGFYLSELFKINVNVNPTDYPDWFLPIRQLFGLISTTEVAMTYFATFAIALALRKVGSLSKTSSGLYVFFSLLAFSIMVLSVIFTEPFKIAAFAVSIPAIPFLLPYYIGVNLLRQTGNETIDKE